MQGDEWFLGGDVDSILDKKLSRGGAVTTTLFAAARGKTGRTVGNTYLCPRECGVSPGFAVGE